jgi:hypothetical protein
MMSLSAVLGTLILFLPAQHGLYVTADSRHDGGEPAERDNAKKIFLCGPNSICAISGALRLTVTPPNGEAQVLEVAQLVEHVAGGLEGQPAVRELAGQIHQRLAPFFEANLSQPVGSRLSARLTAPSVCTILFLHREPDTGLTQLWQVQFPFGEEPVEGGGWRHLLRPPVIRPADPRRPLAQGRTECIQIRADQPPDLETRKRTLETIHLLYARAGLDSSCSTVIGGPVDIGVIDEAGAHWLARKGPQAGPEAARQ